MLLDNGADPNIKNYYGDTVLHTLMPYCSIDAFNLLLSKCNDINTVNNLGHNLLFVLKDDDIKQAQILIERGINCNTINIDGDTLLHRYIYHDYFELFDLVKGYMSKEYINKKNNDGNTILHSWFNCRFGKDIYEDKYIEIINIVNETTINTPNNNQLPLHHAIINKKYKIAHARIKNNKFECWTKM